MHGLHAMQIDPARIVRIRRASVPFHDPCDQSAGFFQVLEQVAADRRPEILVHDIRSLRGRSVAAAVGVESNAQLSRIEPESGLLMLPCFEQHLREHIQDRRLKLSVAGTYTLQRVLLLL